MKRAIISVSDKTGIIEFARELIKLDYVIYSTGGTLALFEKNNVKVKSIKSRIRINCSPKHVPSLIIKVPAIPRTKSGKIVELAVRKIIHGEPINNKEAIANPDVLKYFENLPQLKL